MQSQWRPLIKCLKLLGVCMIAFRSFNEQLDDLLTRICRKVQVSKTEHERANSSYGHVAKWLADAPEGSALHRSNPLIYPQGSLRIGTSVKPIGNTEFDVDLVCEFQLPWERNTPQHLLEATFNRLNEHKTLREMLPMRLEPGKRCVTLTYKNEFHIDVLPACPTKLGVANGFIKVADKKIVGAWKDSNPKGYAEWFDRRSTSYSMEFQEELRKAMVIEFPDHPEFEITTPLQRSVQLLKRWRDVSFYGSANPDRTPISVVITTLAATRYGGQTSVNHAISAFLYDMHSKISTGQRITVPNPEHPSEDFAERWKDVPGSYETFKEWMIETHRRWGELNNARGPKLGKTLKDMFGEDVAETAIRGQVEILEKSRSNDQLGIVGGTGILTAVSGVGAMPIQKNTFFGGSEK